MHQQCPVPPHDPGTLRTIDPSAPTPDSPPGAPIGAPAGAPIGATAGDNPGNEPAVGTPVGPATGTTGTVVGHTPEPDGAQRTDVDPSLQPPVVAVVVAHNPGDWFNVTLRSLAEQTYDNLSVVVVDANSTKPLTDTVAAALPGASYLRLDTNPGFGPACNAVAPVLGDAAFLLLCHDDVHLADDAVAAMVAEAFRANAGVVGPKHVMWDDPRRLLAVGMQADRLGQPVSLVDRGELDQGQHDGTSDVFFIPGGATLIRSDLFTALDGFDPDIDFHGEDLDLCWRARVAGATVVVAPDATVGHLEALGLRRPRDDRRRLQVAHRLRSLRVATTTRSRLWLTPLALVVTIIEAFAAMVMWRPGHVADLFSAWWWNLTHARSLRTRRKGLVAVRAVGDREVRRAQVGGVARLRALAAARRASATQPGTGDAATMGPIDAVAAATPVAPMGPRRGSLVALVVTAAFFLVGSRTLLTGRIPVVGDFVTFGDNAGGLLATWWSGWLPVGLGAPGVAPGLVGVFGVMSGVLFGATGLARTVAILAALPLSALGVWRLVTPLGSLRVRVVALVAAVANPVTYDAVATGNWSTLALVGVLPWVVLHLVRAGAIEPFTRHRSTFHHLVAAGLLTGVATLWFPAAPIVVLAVAVALVAGGLIAGSAAGSLRMLWVAVGAAVVAVVVNAPWFVTTVTNPGGVGMKDIWVWLGAATGGVAPTGAAVLRLETGPVGSSVLGFALVIAGLPALLFGRSWRLAWAARAWFVVVVSWAALVALGQGWFGSVNVAPGVLAAPTVMALSVAVAAAMAAVRTDLSGYRAGWRQLASLIGLVALVVSVLPVAGSAWGGRWDLPVRGIDDKLAFLDDERTDTAFRVLWISEADRLPLASWPVTPWLPDDRTGVSATVGYATTDHGLPDPSQLFTVAAPSGTDQLGDAVAAALVGDTNRLGELVGPMAVRYVVVPQRFAPGAALPTDEPANGADSQSPSGQASGSQPPGSQAPGSQAPGSQAPGGLDGGTDTGEGNGTDTSRPDGASGVVDAMSRQLDLSAAPVGGDVRVWVNTAWVPNGTMVPGPISDAADVHNNGDDTGVFDTRRRGATGVATDPGTLFVAEQFDRGWSLDAEGQQIAAGETLGWATAFDDVPQGSVNLTWSASLATRVGTIATPLLWLVGLWLVARRPAARRTFTGATGLTTSPVTTADVGGVSGNPAPTGVFAVNGEALGVTDGPASGEQGRS